MTNTIKELVSELKLARKKKGFSQRSYAKLIEMPQGRLSKIENGLIDIRASNLLELARSLDLELMLIPRQMVSLVRNLIRDAYEPKTGMEEKPLYRLGNEELDEDQDGVNDEP